MRGPAFRFPDPTAPASPTVHRLPAPPVLEATADRPGPAVAPGSPCSSPRHRGSSAAAGGTRSPCAGVRSKTVALRAVAAGFPAPVDVQTSPPNPNGICHRAPGSDHRTARKTDRMSGTPVPAAARRPTGHASGDGANRYYPAAVDDLTISARTAGTTRTRAPAVRSPAPSQAGPEVWPVDRRSFDVERAAAARGCSARWIAATRLAVIFGREAFPAGPFQNLTRRSIPS